MISVNEAINKINLSVKELGSLEVSTSDALGYVLNEDIVSTINMPPFDQSAMDGYALHLHSSKNYTVIGEVKAGDESRYTLKQGEAVRIFTGGMVPEGANAVAKQEDVTKNENSAILNEIVGEGTNIRPKGEQIMTGALAMKKGTFLNPGAIGFLATLGLTKVSVFRKPIITIIATGNELTKPGEPLAAGKIYESNTFMLKAALKNTGYNASMLTVEDDYVSTRNMIDKAIESSDVVIMTGGISVGDYDFVAESLAEIGVDTVFYKVKQKPGKPLYFGTKNDKLIFALPGNPAAALSCFYIYVLQALNATMGKSNPMLRTSELKLKSAYNKAPKMTHFLKAYADNGHVEILPAQSSAMLSSFVEANCIVTLDQGKEEWNIGDSVKAFMLPD